MSKQLLLALGAGGAAAAAVVSSAASIGSVNSTDLGAGTQVVASCDSNIDVSYTTSYDSTLGGYVTEQLGRLPSPGETLELAGYLLTVVKADKRHVRQVTLRKQHPHMHRA